MRTDVISFDSEGYSGTSQPSEKTSIRVLILYPAHKQQDDENKQDQSQPATWVVAPSSAMRPGRQCAKQHQHQNYDQYRKHKLSPFALLNREWFEPGSILGYKIVANRFTANGKAPELDAFTLHRLQLWHQPRNMPLQADNYATRRSAGYPK
jgi:hypothetical protein